MHDVFGSDCPGRAATRDDGKIDAQFSRKFAHCGRCLRSGLRSSRNRRRRFRFTMRELSDNRVRLPVARAIILHQGVTDGNDVAGLAMEFCDATRLRRGNFHYCLFRLYRQQGLIGNHMIAFRHLPGDNLRLLEAFSQVRQAKGVHDNSITSRAVCTICFCPGI